MKKLDLNAYGVEAMSKQEMRKKNGGSFFDFLYEIIGIEIADKLWAIAKELGKKHADIVASNPTAFIQ